MMLSLATCIPLLALFLNLPVDGAKILVIPCPTASHVWYFNAISERLLSSGNNVHLLVSEGTPAQVINQSLTVIKTQFGDVDMDFAIKEYTKAVIIGMESNLNQMEVAQMMDSKGLLRGICDNILADSTIMSYIAAQKFDLMFIDGFYMTRCFLVIPYKFNVPFVTMSTQYEPWLYRIPALPSFTPFAVSNAYTEHLNTWQVMNTMWKQMQLYLSPPISVMRDDMVRQYAPEKPFKSLTTLAGEAMLILFNTNVCLDYPRVSLPHVIDVGGLTAKPPSALPTDLQKYMDGSKDGVIIASFGSASEVVPPASMREIFDALSKRKENVIFKNRGTFEDVPGNIRIMSWIPQNDILAHKNVKLFITHGGNNGQFEALYHGVPMLVLPGFGEQPSNAIRIAYKGYGETLRMLGVKSDELQHAIDKIITNPEYKQRIVKAGKIFKSSPMTPVERAVYWIEHVIQFGGSHLRSAALDMPWYRYMMLDVLAIIVVGCCLIIAILCILCCSVYRLSAKGKAKRD